MSVNPSAINKINSFYLRHRKLFDNLTSMAKVGILFSPDKVSVQLWKKGNKTIIHLINHDFNLSNGVISKYNFSLVINLNLSINSATLISLT